MSCPKLKLRLNKILDKVTSESFLENKGRGNEVPFHIFDYPATDELQVREHLNFLNKELQNPEHSTKHTLINLFDLVLEILNSRGFLEKSIKLQKENGNQALLKALKGPLHEDKVAAAFGEKISSRYNLVLVSGVGSVYPILRTHTLLENLQPILGNTPLVLFYPGEWDQKTFKLFGKSIIASNLTDRRGKAANYYRAFRLIS